MDENEAIDAMELELFQSGAMYLDGVDEDGEIIVKFNMEILKEVNPELHQWWSDEVDQALLDMAEKGLIALDFTGENVIVEITELGKEMRELQAE